MSRYKARTAAAGYWATHQPDPAVKVLVTSNDQTKLLTQDPTLTWTSGVTDNPTIIQVDEATTFQTMTGFGAAMTESAAKVISDLPANTRDTLMADLFDPTNGAGFSFVRVPMGASDFALSDYTYADTQGPVGDLLANFSVARDDTYVVPRLQQALALNPAITIIATPWSPPAWMRSGGTLKGTTGGTLQSSYFATYADYFVRFVQAYAARGIPVHYVSVQNEPAFAPSYIGMTMSAADQITFIRDYLAPAFTTAGLSTQILAWDHNWDDDSGTAGNQLTYPQTVLGDSGAYNAVAGTAWHGYVGTVAAMTSFHNLYPSKDMFFTEITEFGTASFSSDMRWNARNITIGSPLNWSKSAATWNLALDQNFGPTNGGATNLRGVVQVDTVAGTYAKQPAFYSLAQASKYITPGSVRIDRYSSNPYSIIHTTAYKRPDGGIVIHALNDGATPQPLTLKWGTRELNTTLATGITTYLWNDIPV